MYGLLLLCVLSICSEDLHLHVHLNDIEQTEGTSSELQSETPEDGDIELNDMDDDGADYNSITPGDSEIQLNGMDYQGTGSCRDKRRICRSRALRAGKCDWRWAKRDCKKTCGHCEVPKDSVGEGFSCRRQRDCMKGLECGRDITVCGRYLRRCCHMDDGWTFGPCEDRRSDCESKAKKAGRCSWRWARRDCKKTCQHCTGSETGSWNSWSSYLTCSKSCGGGTHHRFRECDGEGCEGEHIQTKTCNKEPCGDKYETLDEGELCSKKTNIKKEKDCMEAAKELGLEFYESWDGPGDHPGCLHAEKHGDKRKVDKVFFNKSPKPATTAIPGYISICIKSSSSGKTVVFDKDCKTCERNTASAGDVKYCCPNCGDFLNFHEGEFEGTSSEIKEEIRKYVACT